MAIKRTSQEGRPALWVARCWVMDRGTITWGGAGPRAGSGRSARGGPSGRGKISIEDGAENGSDDTGGDIGLGENGVLDTGPLDGGPAAIRGPPTPAGRRGASVGGSGWVCTGGGPAASWRRVVT